MVAADDGSLMAIAPAPPPPLRAAGSDLCEAARLWRLAGTLAWLDIRLRYRGSWLGPLWLSLSTASMIVALGVLGPRLFQQSARDYIPYLAISLVLWNALSHLMAEACQVFTQQEATIHTLRLPFCLHAARATLRGLLVLTHQAVVLLPVFLLFGIHPSAALWTLPAALALWALDGFCLLLALGAIGARFRDLPPMIASGMQLAFFVTPIFWQAEQLGHHAIWLLANPFHAMIELLRAPLLGQAFPTTAWAAALAFSALLMIATAAIFTHARPRLAFWV